MSISKRYEPGSIEGKWYKVWLDKKYFHSEPDEREPFTIVIPPPNVTGVLHMGHMLNNTIQDVLVRKARLDGKNACWVPGTDHASIATEAKVVKMLREKGIKKSDITREEFLKFAFEWKEKYGGIILDQLQKLGASCDWERTRFTMEPKLSKAVVKVFVDLHRKGRLYKGLRMIQWDPVAKTVLSNEEVIYTEENSKLYYLKYMIEGENGKYLTIATTRPETLLGDTAVAVNPKDERFAHLKGKTVIVPLVNRPVPIIFDRYVDMEFGTGALKITPAHDPNDYEIGTKHNLEVIDIFNEDATLNEAAQFYVGTDRFEARKLIVKDLQAADLVVKIEDYINKVGRSERTNSVVEPRLSKQWFLKMDEFAASALHAVESGEVTFHPKNMINMYRSWLREENVRDWCISRQLWWGQQIPAWYTGDDSKPYVAETIEEALAIAKKETGNNDLTINDLRRDEDVVDTWFSSWLWPLSVFDAWENPEELKYYYPTNLLVTGWDIMFFWVARMIMAGYEWAEDLLGAELAAKKGKQPFNDVYFTGMVRDEHKRKMSKSLGNSPDALKLIEKYGADGVRFGMLSSTSAGNDIIFDAPFDPKTKKVKNESKLCELGRNFNNKMWNALRLIKGWEVTDVQHNEDINATNHLAIRWFESKLNETLATLEKNYKHYRLSDGLKSVYALIWNDFCSWYLEMIKPPYGEPIDRATYEKTIDFFEKQMIILHPFMPFVTEEIYSQLKDRADDDHCTIATYPAIGEYDERLIATIDKTKDLVAKIRDTRNKNGIKMKEELRLFVEKSDSAKDMFSLEGLFSMISKMANLKAIEFTGEEVDNSISFLSGTEKYFVEVNNIIDKDAERKRLQAELDYALGFVAQVEKKLSNERFVNNAPEKVVNLERKKLADGLAKVNILRENLEKL